MSTLFDLCCHLVIQALHCRQVDQARQQQRQAQQAAEQAHDSLGHMEAHVATLTHQLYQAHEDHHKLQVHFEVCSCLIVYDVLGTLLFSVQKHGSLAFAVPNHQLF